MHTHTQVTLYLNLYNVVIEKKLSKIYFPQQLHVSQKRFLAELADWSGLSAVRLRLIAAAGLITSYLVVLRVR